MNDILQLKITLQRTKPPIWRRVLVDRQITFLELHYIIQIAMGWMNCHLFGFNINGYRIALAGEGMEDWEEGESASEVTLDGMISNEGDSFEYEYDFGDGWDHKIIVEKFLPREAKREYPVCIDGKLNCPPEDCGGVYGFYDLLEIVKNKKHPEHKEMTEWLGGKYNPEHFDIAEANRKFGYSGKSPKRMTR